jgi:hypothetical protein
MVIPWHIATPDLGSVTSPQWVTSQVFAWTNPPEIPDNAVRVQPMQDPLAYLYHCNRVYQWQWWPDLELRRGALIGASLDGNIATLSGGRIHVDSEAR